MSSLPARRPRGTSPVASVIGGGALLAALLAPAPAPAWVRTTTCVPDNPSHRYACEEGEEAIPISWPGRCVGWHINEVGSPDFPEFDRMVEIMRASFQVWDDVDCSYLELPWLGLTNETRVGYDLCGGGAGNANIVVFVPQYWSHQPLAVALTSVTYDPKTGVVYDADIEINTSSYWFTEVIDPDSETERMDLQNALTHEVGHLVGLDHTLPASFVPGEGETSADFGTATMYAGTGRGEIRKRDLHSDDILGFCDAYPMESADEAPPCREEPDYFQAPEGPYHTEPCPEPEDGCRCATSGSRHGAGPAALLSTLLLARRRQRGATA